MKPTSNDVPWPDLPLNRGDIDRVSDLLKDWITWAGQGISPAKSQDLFRNSLIHVLQCALILRLYMFSRGQAQLRSRRFGYRFDSLDFKSADSLDAALDSDSFPNGYPVELAEALQLCYALEEPWSLPEEYASELAADLMQRLAFLALYDAQGAEYWQERAEHAARDAAAKQVVIEQVQHRNKERTKSANETRRANSVKNDLFEWLAAQVKAGRPISGRDIANQMVEFAKDNGKEISKAYARMVRNEFLENRR